MSGLVEWLRGSLDEHERAANDVSRHGCDCMDVDCADSALREVVVRTVAAHREILDRHSPVELVLPAGRVQWLCGQCDIESDAWPCADVRSLAAIYRDQTPGFDPSWIPEDRS
jgi:hypothetical protein